MVTQCVAAAVLGERGGWVEGGGGRGRGGGGGGGRGTVSGQIIEPLWIAVGIEKCPQACGSVTKEIELGRAARVVKRGSAPVFI